MKTILNFALFVALLQAGLCGCEEKENLEVNLDGLTLKELHHHARLQHGGIDLLLQ